MDYLPIPGSSVPSEHVFSSAAATKTARRNRISPGTMRELQLLKYGLKEGHVELDFTHDDAQETQEKDLEARMEDDIIDEPNNFEALLIARRSHSEVT
jgi:hypothetical protein